MKNLKEAAAAIATLEQQIFTRDETIDMLRERVFLLEERVEAVSTDLSKAEEKLDWFRTGAQFVSARMVNQGKTHQQVMVHPNPNAKHCPRCGQTKVWGRLGCPSSECLQTRGRAMEVV